VRDGNGFDAGVSQQRGQAVDRDGACVVESGCFGQVLLQQPEPVVDVGVEGEDDDPLPGDAEEFTDAGFQVAPVVHGQEGHHRIGRVVGERDRLRGCFQGRCGSGWALGDHHRARFDSQHRVRRFVGAGAGSHVDHTGGTIEGLMDPGGDSRVRSPGVSVGRTDAVVSRHTTRYALPVDTGKSSQRCQFPSTLSSCLIANSYRNRRRTPWPIPLSLSGM
jgi:hypothetical protein